MQTRWVEEVLVEMGCTVFARPFHAALEGLRDTIELHRPHFVFNLVETVDGKGRLIHLAPDMLEHLGVEFSGCPADAIHCTSNKLLAKQLLVGAGLPTPPWVASMDRSRDASRWKGPWIVKSIWEHASIGMDDSSVVEPEHEEELMEMLRRRSTVTGDKFFAEAFIAGREFNLSLLAHGDGVEVLPPAEMLFEGYPHGKWKILGYDAKWNEASFEALHTRRSFRFAPDEEPLLKSMRETALRCWRLFALRGYARVDFRVDEGGRPWILEVNANPCLSPDAGFMAAARMAGLSPVTVMQRILGPLWRRTP